MDGLSDMECKGEYEGREKRSSSTDAPGCKGHPSCLTVR